MGGMGGMGGIGGVVGRVRACDIDGFDFFVRHLKSPKYIMAPMVDGSDLAYRILGRRYGIQLTYTPMLYSKVFARSAKYRRKELAVSTEDRPLVVQFCGISKEEFLPAALIAQDYCDAIDINLGCPQTCAIQGGYGSALLEHPETVFEIVRNLSENLYVPVFCKMRILPSWEQTIAFAQGLEKSGCKLLAVHGRTKEQKGLKSGPCNWDIIKAIKDTLKIPVIANGGLVNFSDVQSCFEATGCDGVMSAESLLRNPAFFSGQPVDPVALVIEYLELCKQYPTTKNYINAHVFGILFEDFDRFPDIRERFRKTRHLDDSISVFKELQALKLNL
eukprot:TRINITY_DN11525_c0_g1_i2.p1 TRINITY_DN11525_c0_g1~~TRINITY_DN11525_c0_g1_i2.p1  ORF type:complete len:332 (+),score=60.73 TRINITY_DN11525_c0_g1_i2:1023-2018(+)